MIKKLHIDIETYSSVDISTSGHYKYTESIDFEILMIAYAYDNGPTSIIDLAQGEQIPQSLIEALIDVSIEKWAHNATFERNAFKAIGINSHASQWHCTAVKAGYCGFPLSLDAVSKAMKLDDKAKLATGKALIRFFCCPVKPTKTNGMRTRNLPHHDLEKWEEFKRYCMQDVEAEREIDKRLERYIIPAFERQNYILDQKINDIGIRVDEQFAINAVEIDERFSLECTNRVKDLTGIDNPNSPAQLKVWLTKVMQKDINTLAKDTLEALIEEAGVGVAGEVLALRKKLSKTSIKKYTAMLNCLCIDGRAHGLFQFYGANRTGRWAGRLIQLQNLVRNTMQGLDLVRQSISDNDYELLTLLYDDLSQVLSQLVRTAFIPKEGYTFAIADFSAIEARVIAWLASERWRMEVFETHGKIYEASASMMFNVPIEQITKGSSLRDKGKVAELALGYQGAVGALKQMGGEKMGLSEQEMQTIVDKWRKANPRIVGLWQEIETCAVNAVQHRCKVTSKHQGINFNFDGQALIITLPSKRQLFYQNPILAPNQWGKPSLKYMGMDQTTKQWTRVDTYGGKLVENIIQAIARDCLADSMLRLDNSGFSICMHVHDEVICEVTTWGADNDLKIMNKIMSQPISWAKGLNLKAEGYLTPFYKKD